MILGTKGVKDPETKGKIAAHIAWLGETGILVPF